MTHFSAVKLPSTALIAGKAQTVATLASAGILRPQRPDRLYHALRALIRWGATPAAGYKAAAARHPDRLALIDESGTLTFAQVHERSNALAHALRAEGVGAGDRVAIMCRNHRGWVESYVAVNKLGAHALFLNTAFSGPQLTDVARARGPGRGDLRRGVRGADRGRDRRPQALHRLARARGRPDRPHDRRPGRRRRHRRPRPAGRAGQGADPDLGHDRQAQGREPAPAAVARPGRRAARADPAQGGGADDDRRAAVPLLGLRALHARDGPDDDDRAQAQVRAGGDAVADRAPPLHGTDRRPGDAAADPRARRRDPRPLRPLGAQGRPGLGLGAPARDLERLDGPLRREPLQPLRLDRGRVGDDRHPRGPARRARHRRPPAPRHRGEAVRRRRRPGARGRRPGGSSSATSSRSRATRAAATRTRSAACCPPATSGTSTTAAGCSSTAATTT